MHCNDCITLSWSSSAWLVMMLRSQELELGGGRGVDWGSNGWKSTPKVESRGCRCWGGSTKSSAHHFSGQCWKLPQRDPWWSQIVEPQLQTHFRHQKSCKACSGYKFSCTVQICIHNWSCLVAQWLGRWIQDREVTSSTPSGCVSE